METLSENYRLESPFPYHALPRLFAWMQDFKRLLADDFAPANLDEFLVEWQRMESLQVTYGVWRGPTLGGMILVVPINPVLSQLHFLFTRGFWGSDVTLAALQDVCGQHFGNGTRKLMAYVFADNARVISTAKRLGAKNEGFLRKHTLRGGELTDMTALGLLDEDFYSTLGGARPAAQPAELEAVCP